MERFVFYTDTVKSFTETKDGREAYFIEGYASTGDLDLVNDVVTPAAMQDMLSQIKGRSVKVDVEHESWTAGGSPNIVPMGKIVDARVDEKGLFVKAQLNAGVSRFSEVWSSVQDGFIDAFSIAFNNVKGSVKVGADGVKTRFITGLNLLNIALTGNPANPMARFTNVVSKSLDSAVFEGDSMGDQVVVSSAVVADGLVVSPSMADFEAMKEEVKALSAVSSGWKEAHDALVVRLKSLEDEMSKPVLKSVASVEPVGVVVPVVKSKGPMDVFNLR